MKTRTKLYKVGNILNLIVLILMAVSLAITAIILGIAMRSNFFGFLLFFIVMLIPLAWLIPMYIMGKKALKNVGTENETAHLTLSIFTLILFNPISGILFIVASSLYEFECDLKNEIK
ncbi:hypothetical protein [Spiroplasma floricola]|uniref:Uncharacterized protein n=1 Tax=Spiroplasma floricola 23-6 TaxID=1336749 RepID=A0A2K8SE62_9MOLU|nr:hypothetical protein [Spiroplasma floricola]AUB31110.1 hypothetical protein SFLOR_v1c00490 [Spiroplasma floricola 23-6]